MGLEPICKCCDRVEADPAAAPGAPACEFYVGLDCYAFEVSYFPQGLTPQQLLGDRNSSALGDEWCRCACAGGVRAVEDSCSAARHAGGLCAHESCNLTSTTTSTSSTTTTIGCIPYDRRPRCADDATYSDQGWNCGSWRTYQCRQDDGASLNCRATACLSLIHI